MYSNESKKGFSIIDLIVKIIFAALFIFILIWLFNKKMPNMKPVYSGIFRENIKYMQDAGEAYFTDDKMPTVEGESVRLTLEEMEKMNIVIPFTDKDGNTCDKTASYVSVTKLEGEDGYELKTNLVCGDESNYVIKKLGCHNYCPNNGNCNKKCEISKITEYEYKKLVSGKVTKYSCAKGYTLKGSKCIKTTLKDSKTAWVTKTESKTLVKAATLVKTDAKLKQLTTDKTTSTDTKNATAVTSTDTKNATAVTSTDTKSATKTTSTDTKDATAVRTGYTCQKQRTENQCTTTPKQVAYSCDCGTRYVNGMPTYTCNTCYKTVQETTCKDVTVTYNDTCYKTTYNCNKYSGYTLDGTQCKKTTTTYNCNKYSGYTLDGSKCKKTTTTYNCNAYSGYTLDGTKCKKTITSYSCPSGTDVREGSGSSLKCYQKLSGETYYTCDSGWKLNGSTCTKTEKVTSKVKECKDKGYKLEGDKCNLYSTSTVKATAKTSNSQYYKYVWSKNTTLAGYTRTGKTRTVDGEEICK